MAPRTRVVGEYEDITRGEMVVALLQSEGIAAWISRNEGFPLPTNVKIGPPRPPVAVSVPADDLDRARRILEDLLFPAAERESSFDDAAWREADTEYAEQQARAQREEADAKAREADRAGRYEEVRAHVVRSVRSGLRSPEERRILEMQAALSYRKLVALGQHPDTLTDAGRAIHRALMEAVDRALR